MRNRGLSTVVNYVLVLGILTLLTTGLFVSMSGFVEDQREETIRSELEVVGNRLATDIAVAERLSASAGESGTVQITPKAPSRVAGAQYEIQIQQAEGDDQHQIVLRSIDPEVTVMVTQRTEIPVENTTVDGGQLRISYDGGAEQVVVENV